MVRLAVTGEYAAEHCNQRKPQSGAAHTAKRRDKQRMRTHAAIDADARSRPAAGEMSDAQWQPSSSPTQQRAGRPPSFSDLLEPLHALRNRPDRRVLHRVEARRRLRPRRVGVRPVSGRGGRERGRQVQQKLLPPRLEPTLRRQQGSRAWSPESSAPPLGLATQAPPAGTGISSAQ